MSDEQMNMIMQAFTDMHTGIKEQFGKVEERFDKVEERLKRIENSVEYIKSKVYEHDQDIFELKRHA